MVLLFFHGAKYQRNTAVHCLYDVSIVSPHRCHCHLLLFNAFFFSQDAARRETEQIKLAERRAQSDMEHEALLRLEALERAGEAEQAESETREARAAAESEAESLRAKVTSSGHLYVSQYLHTHFLPCERTKRVLDNVCILAFGRRLNCADK